MRLARIVIACLLIGISLPAISHAECNDTDAFIEAINAAWVSTNYPLILQTITNRLEEHPDDLLALGLKYEYFLSAGVDYLSAKEAAQAYILAVSNRVPEEINEKRVGLGLPIMIAREQIPTHLPPVPQQARTPEQVVQMHTEFPEAFPFMNVYQMIEGRIKLIEEGSLIWGVGFVESEE